MEAAMTHVYFHCSNADHLILDAQGIDVEDLTEAQQRALGVIRAFVSRKGPDDWRAWSLHASDEDGEELFQMPFACVLGWLH
jgi:leucyl aminopeptidase